MFAILYTEYIYGYCKGCFERLVSSLNKDGTVTIDGKRHINFGSYNYLGFGGSKKSFETNIYMNDSYPISSCCSRYDLPEDSKHLKLLEETENTFAEFIGKESCVIYPMGWATNVTTIPLLTDNTLIFSDELNHASIAMGCKLSSNTKIIAFNNNDPVDLEKKIIENKDKYNFEKIMIIIEGLYSMEGTIVNLPEFVKIKKKYNAFIYLDEAHSIGALGEHGKGACEYFNIDPNDVDVLMGTFTKSFASVGGYVCGSKELIDMIKSNSSGVLYDTCIGYGSLMQIYNVLNNENDMMEKVKLLKNNIAYIRNRLKKECRLQILGDDDSPVIPVLTHNVIDMVKISSDFLDIHNIALVVASYPATSMNGSRLRLCISSSHTKEQLDFFCDCINKI